MRSKFLSEDWFEELRTKLLENYNLSECTTEYRSNPTRENLVRMIMMSDLVYEGCKQKANNHCNMGTIYFEKMWFKPSDKNGLKVGYSVDKKARFKDSTRTGLYPKGTLAEFSFYPGALKIVDKLIKDRFPSKQLLKKIPENLGSYGWTELYRLDSYDEMYKFVKQIYDSKKFDDIKYDIPKSAN